MWQRIDPVASAMAPCRAGCHGSVKSAVPFVVVSQRLAVPNL